MATKAPTGRALAAALCKKFPDTPSRTLAKRLYAENASRFTNLEGARCAIRVVRGNHSMKKRKYATVPRPNGKAGWVPSCPPSAAEPWLPIELPTPCKILSLSDVHIPYHDKQALSWIRGQFPKAEIKYKLGNHDERLDTFVWRKCVELWGMENLQLHNVLDFEKFGIERIGDNPILAGELPIFHGHELGKGIFSPVNPARGAFLRTKHTVLIGHHHQTSGHGESNMWHKYVFCWSQGCLCDMTPEYARINKWNHGFAFIDVCADSSFNVTNYRIDAGKVYS
jgi:hypothetical protein